MKNWKIGTRITVGFGAVIAVALALGIFAYILVGGVAGSSKEITGSALPGLYLMAQIQNSVQKNFSAVLTLLDCKDRRQAAQMDAAILNSRAQNTNVLAEYEKIVLTAKDRELLGNVKAARAVYSTAFDAVLQSKRAAKDQEAAALVDSQLRPAHARYVEAAAELMANAKSFADEKSRGIEDALNTTRTGLKLGLTMAVLIACFVAWFIVRSITRPLATAERLIESVSEIGRAHV